MKSPVIRFSLTLLFSLAITFAVHLVILSALQKPLFDNLLIRAYIANFVLAVLIYFSLFRFREKYHEQLGFLFMFGSFLKFGVFFFFFYPSYKTDGKMEGEEFAAFFVPYAISLIFETLGVIKFLKK